jgi:hypothetical protein
LVQRLCKANAENSFFAELQPTFAEFHSAKLNNYFE